MGIQRQNGYSATVEAFLKLRDLKIDVAKTNCVTLTLADSCELAPGTECDLVFYIDGRMESRLVRLDEGVTLGQRDVAYSVVAPF